ncbi:Lrp/AsnC family transcriptional regulator, partial [Kitasatospora sp. NPDC048540]|uniref:Lrp/AsnC family transcriptional regulator n=1 Tax=Kitasatospora sp. NPDC048540 TaxID=3155634 RepID=UPI0033F4F239
MDTDSADPAGLLDLLDRQLVCALQVDGRAGTGRIAEVLGVSARTVTRRLSRLTGTGLVKVVLMPDAHEAATGAVLLRVRVLKGKVRTIAQALAARPDVPFVDVMLGGQEIGAVVLADGGARDHLLNTQLPATGAVVETAAHAVLHLFADAGHWRAGWLSPEQEAALAAPAADPAPAGTPPPGPDALDRRLLAALAIPDRGLDHGAYVPRVEMFPAA